MHSYYLCLIIQLKILCFHYFIEIVYSNSSSKPIFFSWKEIFIFRTIRLSLGQMRWENYSHWVIDDNTNGMVPFVQKIRAFFREELDGKRFRLYTMPPNFSDLKDRVRIQTWEEVSTFINSYFFHVFMCDALPLFFSSRIADKTSTKREHTIVTISISIRAVQ